MPSPATKWVISGQSRQISGPVPSKWALGLAGLPYWYKKVHSGCAAASCLATRTAPFDPSLAGESMTSACQSSRSCRLSIETLPGKTTLSLYPFRRHTIAIPMPVLPEDGSMSVAPGASRPVRSASSIIERAILSFTEPPGFCPSSLARSRTSRFGLSAETSTSGVLPISSRTLLTTATERLVLWPT